MISKYFKIIINIDTSIENRLICLFINSIEEREKLQDQLTFNKDVSKTKIKNKALFKDYLTTDEHKAIGTTYNIVVSNYTLFYDDNVDEMKTKLFFTLKTHKILINPEHLNICANSFSTSFLKTEKDNDKAEQLYNILSNNKKNMITWDILAMSLLNCGAKGLDIIKKIDRKMYYFYDDLKEFEPQLKTIATFYKPITHYFTTTKQRLQFVYNPMILTEFLNNLFLKEPRFYEKEFDYLKKQTKFIEVLPLLLENTNEILSTNNAKTLYDFAIDENTLYAFQPFHIEDSLIDDFSTIENTTLKKYILSLFSSFYFPSFKALYKPSIDNIGMLNIESINESRENATKKNNK